MADEHPIVIGYDSLSGEVNIAQGFPKAMNDPYSCTYNLARAIISTLGGEKIERIMKNQMSAPLPK